MADEQTELQTHPDPGRLAVGIAVAALGVLLLLDRAGIVDWGTRSGWWPIVVILFGATRLAFGADGVRSGIAWVLVGVWGLLNEYGVLQYEESWPLLLVIAGGALVLGSFGERGRGSIGERIASRAEARADRWTRRRRDPGLVWLFILFAVVMSTQGRFGAGFSAQARRINGQIRRSAGVQVDSGDTVRRSAILSENRSVSESSQFRGASVNAIMGDCELDLTRAAVPPGEVPEIHVVVVMGQATLRIPSNWIVENRVVAVMGQAQDVRTRTVADDSSPASQDAAAQPTHVVVRGAVTMGELDIKN